MKSFLRVFTAAVSLGLFAAPVAFAQSSMSNSSGSSMQRAKPDSGMMMKKPEKKHKKPVHEMSNMSMSNGMAMKKKSNQ